MRNAWSLVRELLESLDRLILFESHHSVLNLYFNTLYREEPIMWIIDEYVAYIKYEVILNIRRVSRADFLGYLRAKRVEHSFLAIPEIG